VLAVLVGRKWVRESFFDKSAPFAHSDGAKRRVNFPAHDADRRLIDALAARGFVGVVKPEATRIVVWSKHN
jgi:hypothetical protein